MTLYAYNLQSQARLCFKMTSEVGISRVKNLEDKLPAVAVLILRFLLSFECIAVHFVYMVCTLAAGMLHFCIKVWSFEVEVKF